MEYLAPPPLEFDPRTLQPVASLYTDWAIPAHLVLQDSHEWRTLVNTIMSLRFLETPEAASPSRLSPLLLK